MTRSELVSMLADRFPQLVRADADLSVSAILDAIAGTLAKGGRIEIRGFGSFSLNHRPARVGRNPKTGKKVSVPAKWTPHFKAGKELRESVHWHTAVTDVKPDYGRITSASGPAEYQDQIDQWIAAGGVPTTGTIGIGRPSKATR
ncbi:MAG: integration host factor subunit beta [Dechloromonas sp.]|nr:MAG: integration host factor subunit beta [Dechloromonas sp.]